MPRRRNHEGGPSSHSGGLASYFYDAQNGDGLAPLPQSRVAVQQPQQQKGPAKDASVSFLGTWDKDGNWIGPGPEPRRRPRSRSVAPGARAHSVPRPRVKKARPEGRPAGEMSANQMRHTHKVAMGTAAATMKTHFSDSERIYADHDAWLLHATYMKIQGHIGQCKSEIAEIRAAHKGAGQHKAMVEAVHKTQTDVTAWHLKQIHDDLEHESNTHRVPNHLKLERPYAPEGGPAHIVYVNVALAWLFAAKRQLMTVVEADVKAITARTPMMESFIEGCDQGREARRRYLEHKHALGVKSHSHSYELQDQADIKHQHDVFYGSA